MQASRTNVAFWVLFMSCFCAGVLVTVPGICATGPLRRDTACRERHTGLSSSFNTSGSVDFYIFSTLVQLLEPPLDPRLLGFSRAPVALLGTRSPLGEETTGK